MAVQIRTKFASLHAIIAAVTRRTGGAGGLKKIRKSLTSDAECNINASVNAQFRIISTISSLVFALAIWLPNGISADELKEAKVTQVIQDVKLLSSNRSRVSARRRSLVWAKGREPLIWAAAKFCFMCRRNPAARKSRWGRSPPRSQAQPFLPALIPAESPHS